MKWAVEIQRTSLDGRSLADLLGGLGFTLIDGIDFPAFTSLEINGCASAEEVFALAKQVRAAFTGPADIDSEFSLGSVIDYSFDPPKRRAFLEVNSSVHMQFVGSPTITASPPKALSDEQLKIWEEEHAERAYQAKLENQRARLEPAYRNARAARVLKLLELEDHSGVTLWRIYELAEGHPSKREAFHKQFGVTAEQFRRFKDAVHNFTVSGDWARHTYDEKPKTSNPMSKKEAERFVRELAARWLALVRKGQAF
jgi:hypothetical protein